jgi:uncharacterized membrane protein required for colicin V production
MSLTDIILLCFLGAFAAVGLWLGLVHMVGSLVGFFVGLVVAGMYYGQLAEFFGRWIDNANAAKVFSFILILIVIGKLIGVVVHLIDRVFKVVSIIPFVKTFNRLLGAAFGLIEGAAILGIGVWFAARFPLGPGFELALRGSQVAKTLKVVGSMLSPLLPVAVQAMRSVI